MTYLTSLEPLAEPYLPVYTVVRLIFVPSVPVSDPHAHSEANACPELIFLAHSLQQCMLDKMIAGINIAHPINRRPGRLRYSAVPNQ